MASSRRGAPPGGDATLRRSEPPRTAWFVDRCCVPGHRRSRDRRRGLPQHIAATPSTAWRPGWAVRRRQPRAARWRSVGRRPAAHFDWRPAARSAPSGLTPGPGWAAASTRDPPLPSCGRGVRRNRRGVAASTSLPLARPTRETDPGAVGRSLAPRAGRCLRRSSSWSRCSCYCPPRSDGRPKARAVAAGTRRRSALVPGRPGAGAGSCRPSPTSLQRRMGSDRGAPRDPGRRPRHGGRRRGRRRCNPVASLDDLHQPAPAGAGTGRRRPTTSATATSRPIEGASSETIVEAAGRTRSSARWCWALRPRLHTLGPLLAD